MEQSHRRPAACPVHPLKSEIRIARRIVIASPSKISSAALRSQSFLPITSDDDRVSQVKPTGHSSSYPTINLHHQALAQLHSRG